MNSHARSFLEANFTQAQQDEIRRQLAEGSMPASSCYNAKTNIVTIRNDTVHYLHTTFRRATSEGILRLKKPLSFLITDWDKNHPPVFNFPEYDRSLFSVEWVKLGHPDTPDPDGFYMYRFYVQFVGSALNNVDTKGEFINTKAALLTNGAGAGLIVSALQRSDITVGSMFGKPSCTLDRVTTYPGSSSTFDVASFPEMTADPKKFSKLMFFNTGYTFNEPKLCSISYAFADERVIFTYGSLLVKDPYTPQVLPSSKQAPSSNAVDYSKLAPTFVYNTSGLLPAFNAGIPKTIKVTSDSFSVPVTTSPIDMVTRAEPPVLSVSDVCEKLKRGLGVGYVVEEYDLFGQSKIKVTDTTSGHVIDKILPDSVTYDLAWHLIHLGLSASRVAYDIGVAEGLALAEKRMQDHMHSSVFGGMTPAEYTQTRRNRK